MIFHHNSPFSLQAFLLEKVPEGPKTNAKTKDSLTPLELPKSKEDVAAEKEKTEVSAARSRLEKAIGDNFRPMNDIIPLTVKNKITGDNSLFAIHFLPPDKVELQALGEYAKKKSLFTTERLVNSRQQISIKDFMVGKELQEAFKPLLEHLNSKEKENKMRESKRLIEDEAGLKFQISAAYDSTMEQLFSDQNFLKNYKTNSEFQNAFNDLFKKTFSSNAIFSASVDQLSATENGVRIFFKRTVTGKAGPAFNFTDNYYSNLDGLFAVKRNELVSRESKDKSS